MNMDKAIWLSTRPGGTDDVISAPIPYPQDRRPWTGAVFRMIGNGAVQFLLQASYDGCCSIEFPVPFSTSVGLVSLVLPTGKYAYLRMGAKLTGPDAEALVDLVCEGHAA